MTQHPALRFLLHPLSIPSVVTVVLLAANLVPQARFGIPVILDPSSKQQAPCDAILQYGWPKIARVDEGNYFFGTNAFHAQTTQTSVVTHIANGVFGIALVLLSAFATRLIVDRKLTLKSVFAVVTLAGVLFASFRWGVSLSMSEDMAGSLRWTAALSQFVDQNPRPFFTWTR